MDTMSESARTGVREALIYCDLLFYLALSELSHNPYLIKNERRMPVPLFAFVRMRVSASGQSTFAWEKDFDAHQRNIDLIREGRERSHRALCEQGHGTLCKDCIRLLGETRRTCQMS
jgi:DNA-binding GntR family transcriptional regulator